MIFGEPREASDLTDVTHDIVLTNLQILQDNSSASIRAILEVLIEGADCYIVRPAGLYKPEHGTDYVLAASKQCYRISKDEYMLLCIHNIEQQSASERSIRRFKQTYPDATRSQ